MKRKQLLPVILAALLALVSVQTPGQNKDAYRFGKCVAGELQHKEYSLKSIFITMKDGTRIAADVYLPKGLAEGAKLPAMLTQTRYWRSSEGGGPGFQTPFFLDHGFVVIVTDVRGTGASFGRWPYPWSKQEIADSKDVVRWIIKQPWSNGKVATIGTSYTANTAEFTALSDEPAVKAVVPRFSDFDVYAQLSYPGGIPNEFMMREWGHVVKDLDDNKKEGDPPHGVRPVDEDKDGSLLKSAVEGHADNPDVYKAAQEITYRDDRPEKWSASMTDFCTYSFRKEFENSRVPIYGWASWLDSGTSDGALSRFMTFKNPQRTVIGPWSHGGGFQVSPYIKDHKAVNPTPESEFNDALCFVNHYINGSSPDMSKRLLIYYTLGEEKWKTTTTWPVPGTVNRRMYFAADNALGKSFPSGTSGADDYKVNYDATTGTTNRWYTQLGGGDVVYPDRAEEDKKLLTYTSEPLPADTEITGYPIINLFLKSTATDGAFIVYLEDVDPEGHVTYVTEGELRGVQRKISPGPRPYNSLMPYHTFKRKDGEPLVPGKVALLKFGLWPTSVLIRKGHRIRIAIAGADKDTFVRIPAEGDPTITVERNSRYASFVDLPVVGRARKTP